MVKIGESARRRNIRGAFPLEKYQILVQFLDFVHIEEESMVVNDSSIQFLHCIPDRRG